MLWLVVCCEGWVLKVRRGFEIDFMGDWKSVVVGMVVSVGGGGVVVVGVYHHRHYPQYHHHNHNHHHYHHHHQIVELEVVVVDQ